MNTGPFQTHTGRVVIPKFLTNELNPLIKELRELAIDSSKVQLGLQESFTRRQIKLLEKRSLDVRILFMQTYQKFYDPDLFLKSKSSNENPQHITEDYLIAKNLSKEYFDEGFHLITYIDKKITGLATSAYNRVAMFLSIMAITISIIIAILK